MDMNHSSCWDSILERAKPQIPTIDSDSSFSDNEEIVTLYQRPAGLSLKVPEDFESFSLDDDELEANVCERDSVELNGAKKNPKSEERFPVLSFARLDQWDLDDVLRNLNERGLSLRQHVSVESSTTHADGDKNRSQADIMERLAALCNSQSSKLVSEPVKGPNHTRQNNVRNKSSVGMAAELQRSNQECPTVHIDLRCPDPSIKPQRTSPNLSSARRSPAKHNSHQETPPAKKPNLKVHTVPQMEDREVTGKSMLLQKTREMNRNRKEYPYKHTNPRYPEIENEAEEQKLKTPRAVESAGSHESDHLSEDKHSSHVQFEYNRPKMESPPIPQQSTIKEPKQQRQRQRDKPTLKREQHQQILEELEKHRPTKSVNQEQPAAERTDVLYDFEASHLQSISTLPADIESKQCMLLIIDLCSPGMVLSRVNGKRRKHLYPAATKSHIYNTLVAWFLSLVGPDQCHDEDDAGAEVPFWVAGLQQLWTEEGLALHVLAVARRCYTPVKRDRHIHPPLHTHVWRFLSETSLTRIAGRKDSLDQRASASPTHLPSTCLNRFITAISKKEVIERTFSLSPGFYWQTVETQECACEGTETTLEPHTEVSVALFCRAFFLSPLKTHNTLQHVLLSGLDVCGLRLLYPPQEFLTDNAGPVPVIQRNAETWQPILAFAVRGPHAHSVLKDLTRSLEPLLTKKTDTASLSPPHCISQQPPLCCSPQLATQVHRELCLWFSGRCHAVAENHDQPLNRVLPSVEGVRGSLFSRSPSFLCATTKADLLLVVSPVVPPCCYGQVLAVCERRGFSLMGLQRLKLRRHGAAVLGLTNDQAFVFCSPHAVTLDQEELQLPSLCLVLLLRKENAMLHTFSLPAALMREFMVRKLLGCTHPRLDGVHSVEPRFWFHTVSYSKNLHNIFVRCMWAVPDPSSVILSHHQRSSISNMKQVVILTLCGKDLSQGLSLLHRVLTEGPEGAEQHAGFELLGLKCLPALTRLQAQELSPYEVGEQLCHNSVDSLMSSPVLVCALRRVDAFASLRKLLPHDYPGNLSVLMSPTPEVAFRQASLFFYEHEMIPDPQMPLTVCLFKPRTWNHILAKIVSKLHLSGLTVVGLRVVTLDRGNAASLLPTESDPSYLKASVEYLCSGSSLVLCLEGENAVKALLDVLGQEDSTLRTTCSGTAHSFSVMYGSGSNQEAIADVKRFFPEGLCCIQSSTMRQEQILSMCSDRLASVEREQSCTLAPVAQERRSTSGLKEGSLIHSALWQTTCLLIPLNTPPLSQVPSQLDMLEQLLRSGCHLVAGRMTILDNEQCKHIAQTLKASATDNERMAHLSAAPCLIMALQGETIVTCFTSMLESIFKERSDLQKVGKMIIYPESEEEANQLICYLFDALSPESHHIIVP
ncbi:dynein axonemal assembly factor 8 isoform 1-T1 [Acanthopagrus schlegelii]